MNTLTKIWFPIFTVALLVMGCERAIEYLPALPKVEVPSKKPRKPTLSPQSANTAKIEAAIRSSINQVRQKEKLQPLKNNERLAEVARKYSRQMAEKNFFSHTGVDGSTLASRVEASGIIYWLVGENLFKGTNLNDPRYICLTLGLSCVNKILNYYHFLLTFIFNSKASELSRRVENGTCKDYRLLC